MYPNSETQQDGYGSYSTNRDRGRGGRSTWRGRGRSRFGNFQAQRDAYKQGQGLVRDTSHIACFRCDKFGHYTSECPDRLLKLQETVEKKTKDTQEADEFMMHEVVYLNEKKVYPSVFDTDLDTSNI